MDAPQQGSLSWRLSSHPITLLCFLGFRLCKPSSSLPLSPPTLLTFSLTASLLTYLFGLYFSTNYVLIFIITIILLAIDFYYLKNIAGRRLVGLRWWNEVNATSGDGNWVFESADPESRQINATDKRFFWLALYSQPVSWVVLGIVAIFRLHFIWLSLVGTLSCDQFRLRRKYYADDADVQLSPLYWLSRIPLPFPAATSSARPRISQLEPSLPAALRAISAALCWVVSSDERQEAGSYTSPLSF